LRLQAKPEEIVKPANLPELMTAEQAAEYLGVAVKTLTVWRSTGRYAIPYVVGPAKALEAAWALRFLPKSI
jgi:hypothetical protein